MNAELIENALTKTNFEEILTPLLPRLGYLLRGQLRGLNKADLSDVLQQTLVEAWEKRERFPEYAKDRDGNYESLLIRWLGNFARNHVRKLRKDQRRYVPLKGELRAADATEALERKQALEDAVEASARPDIADAIADGLSDREAARRVGADRRTVAKIRKQLRGDVDWSAQRETEADFHVMAEGTSVTPQARESETIEEDGGSWVDREIARMSPNDKPINNKAPKGHNTITRDPEVRAAIEAIEARKLTMTKKRKNK